MPNGPWTLAIDFGTTYTAAAAAQPGGRGEAIEIDGDRRVPSVVFVAEYSHVIAGRAAENQAAAYPERAQRELKRQLGEPSPIVLAGRPFPVVDLVAALLQHVYERAVEYGGGHPTDVRLTHPATWRKPRIEALREAAQRAGISGARFVSEPVAAAVAYASEAGDLERDGFVGIYDLGGGTFDTAVLRADSGRFSVQGRPAGDGRIGGELFDELLAQHVGSRLSPSTWDELMSSEASDWRQARVAFRNEVRKAKEALSLQDVATLVIPLPTGLEQVSVDRRALEELIAPYVAETVEQFQSTVADAGLSPDELRALYLVGGASRTPMIERELAAALPGIPISKRGDPKMAVALGAVLIPLPAEAAQAAAVAPGATVSVGASTLHDSEPGGSGTASTVNDGAQAGLTSDGFDGDEPPPPPTDDVLRPRGRPWFRGRRAIAAAAAVTLTMAAATMVLAGPFNARDAELTGAVDSATESAEADETAPGTPTPRPTRTPRESASSSASPTGSASPTASTSEDEGTTTTDGGSTGGGSTGGGSTDGGSTSGGSTESGGSTGGGSSGGTTTTPAPTPAPTPVPTPAPTPTPSAPWSTAFNTWCTHWGTEGDDQGNGIRGTEGNDVICGFGGTDLLVGLGGNDLIDGGTGTDRVGYQSAPGGVTVDLQSGQVSGAAGADSLASIEGVMDSFHDDVLYGSNHGQTDYFWLHDGGNFIDGRGGGIDVADYFYAPAGSCGADTRVNVEEVYTCS